MKIRLICLFFSLFLSFSGKAQHKTACEILSHIRYITVDKNKLIRTDSVSMQIFDQRGNSRSRIQIPYTKGDKVNIHYAYIEDKNGNIVRKIKRSEITDASYVSSSSLYQDDFIRAFELKHNLYPYKVKYAYTITENRYLHVGQLPYFGETPVREGLFVVQTTADRPVKYKQKHVMLPEVNEADNRLTYTWSYSYAYEKHDIYAAEESLEIPQITVLPMDFSYGVPGSWKSWESFGNYIYRLNSGLDELPQSEKTKIDLLLQGVEDKTQKIRILYSHLQHNHRYVNVSLGVGGLKSYPAEYVCANRFGDCKALSSYMVSILKYAGIEAFYTLVQLSEKVPVFDEEFPAQVFNHVIVAVPLQPDTLYLECTSSKGPFGYLSTSLQGRKALVVKEQGSHLTDLPAAGLQDVACKTIFDINLLSAQHARITMHSVSRGSDFELYSYRSELSTRSNTDFFMRNALISGTFSLSDYEFLKPERNSDSIMLTVNGEVKNFYRKYGNTLSLNTFIFQLPAFEPPEIRKAAVRLSYPFCREYVMRYHLGETNVLEIPQPVAVESPYGTYSSQYKLEGGALVVYKKLTVNAGLIPLEEYPAFYKFISEVRNHEKPNHNLEIK